MTPKQDLQPLLDAQLSQLEITFQEGSTLDAKALALLAINVALLIFMAQGRLYFGEWWQNVCLYGPFFVSLGFNTVAIWPRAYAGAGVGEEKLPKYLAMDTKALTLQLIATATHAIETNATLNYERWQYCLRSILLTAIGTGAILIYFL